MLTSIINLILKKPGLKANELARELGLTRKELNQILHKKPDIFHKNESFEWSISEGAVSKLSLNSEKKWITQNDFEDALKEQGSPLECNIDKVTIEIIGEQPLLFCAVARLLALSNQLADAGKRVTLDFTNNESTVSYLNRACFFARLAPEIAIVPQRPSIEDSEANKAKSISLVELLELGTEENVPSRIRDSFISVFGQNEATKLFTVVAEMVGNVEDHSETPIPGFAGLQCYSPGNKQSVVVVVSDSGKGICATLRPALAEHFPKIATMFPSGATASDAKLILYAMNNRGLSRTGKGRGAGLHTSREKAELLKAKVTIRQENFSVHLSYSNGALEKKQWKLDLPKLPGTHVVFEFSLTSPKISD
ncbi:ATPase (plasmid) [Pantoea allii]|uniref:ATPase n=1 Tax=Pantoea allii TaxID=574096 RepID=UPI00156113DD|nr:ATPase [Pantoea allii]NQS84306.1 ATPase [Pantoea allii]